MEIRPGKKQRKKRAGLFVFSFFINILGKMKAGCSLAGTVPAAEDPFGAAPKIKALGAAAGKYAGRKEGSK
jgi:hypothetical protein